MTTVIVWLSIAFILFILEILITSSFALLCIAAGAIIAGLFAWIGVDLVWQVLIFAAASLLAFLFIRPFLIQLLNRRSSLRPKTNAEALIGKTATVSERIGTKGEMGRVSINGDYWQALSSDGQSIDVGELVTVESIDSIVLTVKRTVH